VTSSARAEPASPCRASAPMAMMRASSATAPAVPARERRCAAPIPSRAPAAAAAPAAPVATARSPAAGVARASARTDSVRRVRRRARRASTRPAAATPHASPAGGAALAAPSMASRAWIRRTARPGRASNHMRRPRRRRPRPRRVCSPVRRMTTAAPSAQPRQAHRGGCSARCSWRRRGDDSRGAEGLTRPRAHPPLGDRGRSGPAPATW